MLTLLQGRWAFLVIWSALFFKRKSLPRRHGEGQKQKKLILLGFLLFSVPPCLRGENAFDF